MLAVATAEVLLQLTVSPTIEHSRWYTGDIHTPDDKYEFVFTQLQRVMRHFDNAEELSLDLMVSGSRGHPKGCKMCCCSAAIP